MLDLTTDANGNYYRDRDGKFNDGKFIAFNRAGIFMGTFPTLASAQSFLINGNNPVTPKQ